MYKINKRGFTLIELLIIILITSLILALTTYGIIGVVNSAKENSKILSYKSIKEASKTYSAEKEEDRWKDGSGNNTYFCVTIEELINKGLLDKKAEKIENGDSFENYIVVVKDKTTKVIKKELLLNGLLENNSDPDYKEAYSLCTGDINVEEIDTRTKLKNNKAYTDTITTEFEDAIFKKDNTIIDIKDRYCYYGKDTSSVIYSDNTTIDGNTCIVENLKQEEDYYVKVCVKSVNDSLSCSIPKNIKTASIITPLININGENNIKVIYSDDNIYNKDETSYYFKSTMNGSSDKSVSSCTLDNNIYTCNNDSTTNIAEDTWYKTTDKEIILTYQDDGNIKITAETRDKTGNSKSSEKEFSLYKITFDKGTADSINNQTSNIEKMCLADKNSSCKITSPTIAKEGYTAIGWNTNKNATSSSWNVDSKKDVSKSDIYYPILKINTYNVSYNANGGSNAPSNQTKKYNVNLNLSSTKPTRRGYTFINWNTNSNGTGTAYNPSDIYNINDNLTLYAQWRKNKVYIELYTNKGTVTGINTIYLEDDGLVKYYDTKNGSYVDYVHAIDYDGKIKATGLDNYNNSSYLKITRDNDTNYDKYMAVSGAEWKCLSGNCEYSTYDQDKVYSASEFCDASNGDCTVKLGVNWIEKINDYRCIKEDGKVKNFYYITTCTVDEKNNICKYTKENCYTKEGTTARDLLNTSCIENINSCRCLGGENNSNITYKITECEFNYCKVENSNSRIYRCELTDVGCNCDEDVDPPSTNPKPEQGTVGICGKCKNDNDCAQPKFNDGRIGTAKCENNVCQHYDGRINVSMCY